MKYRPDQSLSTVAEKMANKPTLVCLIAEQALLSKQVQNSKVLPALFLFSAYVLTKMRAGWSKFLKIVL